MKKLFFLTFIGILAVLSAGLVYFDEGVYIALSQWIVSGGDAGYFEYIRPLALPVLLIPSLFFSPPLFAARGFMILVTLALIPAVYWACRPFGQKQAFASAFLFSTSFSVIFYGGYVLTDVLAYTLLLVVAGFSFRQKPFLAGLLLGVAFLVKFPVLVFSLPLAWYFRKNLLLLGSGLLLGITPYFLFNAVYYSGPFLARLVSPLLDGSAIVGNTNWIYPAASLSGYSIVMLRDFPIVLLGLFGAFVLSRRRDDLLLLLGGFLLFLLYFSFGVTRFDPRYAIVLVFLFIPLAGVGLVRVRELVSRLPRPRRLLAIGYCLLSLPFLLAIVLAYQHPQSSDEVGELIEEKIVTNTGVALLYAEQAELLPSPNLGHVYAEWWWSEAPQLVLDIDGYPCPPGDTRCATAFSERLAFLFDTNVLVGCGRLHGVRVAIIGRQSPGIDAAFCAERLDILLPPVPEQEVFLRVNDLMFNSTTDTSLLEQIFLLNKTTYLVLNSNTTDAALPFLRSLPPHVHIGIVLDEHDLPERLSQWNLSVEVIVPPGDDWSELDPWTYEKYPLCLVGSWDQSATPFPCREIDLYMYDWSEGVLNVTDSYEALRRSDPVVGVSLPGDKLSEIFENRYVLRVLYE